MVKAIFLLAIISLASGCSLIKTSPVSCKPIEVKVPVIVKPAIPYTERPQLHSALLPVSASPEQALKTMQVDIIQLVDYSKRLELIIDVIRGVDVDTTE